MRESQPLELNAFAARIVSRHLGMIPRRRTLASVVMPFVRSLGAPLVTAHAARWGRVVDDDAVEASGLDDAGGVPAPPVFESMVRVAPPPRPARQASGDPAAGTVNAAPPDPAAPTMMRRPRRVPGATPIVRAVDDQTRNETAARAPAAADVPDAAPNRVRASNAMRSVRFPAADVRREADGAQTGAVGRRAALADTNGSRARNRQSAPNAPVPFEMSPGSARRAPAHPDHSGDSGLPPQYSVTSMRSSAAAFALRQLRPTVVGAIGSGARSGQTVVKARTAAPSAPLPSPMQPGLRSPSSGGRAPGDEAPRPLPLPVAGVGQAVQRSVRTSTRPASAEQAVQRLPAAAEPRRPAGSDEAMRIDDIVNRVVAQVIGRLTIEVERRGTWVWPWKS